MSLLGSERDKPPHFAGRRRELRELSARLDYIRATSDPSGGMALIDGVQGSGKTQLLVLDDAGRLAFGIPSFRDYLLTTS